MAASACRAGGSHISARAGVTGGGTIMTPPWLHSAILIPRLLDLLFGALLFWAGYHGEASRGAPVRFRLRSAAVLLLLALGFFACVTLESAFAAPVFRTPMAAGLLLMLALWAVNALLRDLTALRAHSSPYPEFEDGPDRGQVRQRLSIGDYLVVVENHRILVGKRGRLAAFAVRLALPLLVTALFLAVRLPDILCALPLGWFAGGGVRDRPLARWTPWTSSSTRPRANTGYA
jgi:hypothetical protein